MNRYMKSAIMVGFLTMLLIPIYFVTAQEGQGRRWVADFGTENAKNDGKIRFQIKVQYKHPIWGTIKENTDELAIDVKKGWTPQQKAEALENLLKTKFGDFLIVSRIGGVVSVQLKKGATYRGASLIDITDVTKLKEETTGQKGVHVYDDPYIAYPEVVTFDISGTPMDSASVAILKIGWTYPLVTVNTYGKSPPQIKSEIVYWFNHYYYGTGFVACINLDGAVEIRDVPCEEGITGGADDPELSWTLSIGDPPTAVGGITIPDDSISVDKPILLAPYIGFASTILVATVATSIYAKHVKRRKEKQ